MDWKVPSFLILAIFTALRPTNAEAERGIPRKQESSEIREGVMKAAATRSCNISKRNCQLKYEPHDFENYAEAIRPHLDSFDLREEDAGKICPSIKQVSNQGDCESCWAVVATDVMTDRLCLHTNGTNKNRYSALDPMKCCEGCHSRIKRPNTDEEPHICSIGGSHEEVWKYWRDCGIVRGSYGNEDKSGCLNYEIPKCFFLKSPKNDVVENETNGTEAVAKCTHDFMKCKKVKRTEFANSTNPCKCEGDKDGTAYWAMKEQGKGSCYRLRRKFDGKEEVIKAEIYKNGPVHLSISIGENFFEFMKTEEQNGSYKGDIYKYNRSTEDGGKSCGAHSVRIVGWGKSKEENTSYWIVANTWGHGWGKKGFFYLDINHDKGDTYKQYVYAGIPKTQKDSEYLNQELPPTKTKPFSTLKGEL